MGRELFLGKDLLLFKPGMHVVWESTFKFKGISSASPKREQLVFSYSLPIIQIEV